MKVIEVGHLTKRIARKEILRDVSFEVEKGECLALIGPNGAGKTTLMSCLLNDLKIDEGNIRILDQPVTSPKLKAAISILLQENVLPADFKVVELLEFYRSLYEHPLSWEAIDAYLSFSKEQKNQLTSKLSGGQRRLLAFVLSIIGQPALLFLDEPTTAMDTATRLRFWEIVGDLKKQGMSIIYSSHYIEEVEKMADRILLLHEGVLVRDTTPYALKQEEVEKELVVPLRFKRVLEQSGLVEAIRQQGDAVDCVTQQVDQVWSLLAAAGCRLQDLEMTNRSLLDMIFEEKEEK